MGILYLLVALLLSITVFRLARGMDWPIVLVIFFTLVPLVATFFLGLIGVLASAVFVGALFKASS